LTNWHGKKWERELINFSRSIKVNSENVEEIKPLLIKRE